MKKINLTDIALASEMAYILDAYFCDLDNRLWKESMVNVVDLMESRHLAEMYDSDSVKRIWTIAENESWLTRKRMSKGEVDNILEEFEIRWTRGEGWSIERI